MGVGLGGRERCRCQVCFGGFCFSVVVFWFFGVCCCVFGVFVVFLLVCVGRCLRRCFGGLGMLGRVVCLFVGIWRCIWLGFLGVFGLVLSKR